MKYKKNKQENELEKKKMNKDEDVKSNETSLSVVKNEKNRIPYFLRSRGKAPLPEGLGARVKIRKKKPKRLNKKATKSKENLKSALKFEDKSEGDVKTKPHLVVKPTDRNSSEKNFSKFLSKNNEKRCEVRLETIEKYSSSTQKSSLKDGVTKMKSSYETFFEKNIPIDVGERHRDSSISGGIRNLNSAENFKSVGKKGSQILVGDSFNKRFDHIMDQPTLEFKSKLISEPLNIDYFKETSSRVEGEYELGGLLRPPIHTFEDHHSHKKSDLLRPSYSAKKSNRLEQLKDLENELSLKNSSWIKSNFDGFASPPRPSLLISSNSIFSKEYASDSLKASRRMTFQESSFEQTLSRGSDFNDRRIRAPRVSSESWFQKWGHLDWK